MSLTQARAALSSRASRLNPRDRLLDAIGRCPALGEVWAEYALTALPPRSNGDPSTDVSHLASPANILFFAEEWGNDHLASEHSWPQPLSSPDALATWAGAMRGCQGRTNLAQAWTYDPATLQIKQFKNSSCV